ncbi:hypothetical protein OS493_010115 [Desmophyllum pertusum]|uniref:Uncharacterized protein n=1 Tax=Desmophyllum pertusum TaxID=174260 RepID=A0A9W9YEM0_9CNID|nr:hypothetical protein OS493_010115 [Desmophyllum pertusum]
MTLGWLAHTARYLLTPGHSWAVRKPSTFTQQFKELTNNDILLAGNNDSPLPIPEFKPKWHGGGPCLPSIRPGKTQIVDNFLEKHRRKMQREMEEDFEGWGEPEPKEVKRILERPLSAKLPHYPANWDRLPKESPPGRGGQGYCLGLVWNKPESASFLSDASSEDISELTRNEEKEDVFQANIERPQPPRRRLFADCQYVSSHDSIVQEPVTWCRHPGCLSRYPSTLRTKQLLTIKSI